ncbi:hypothetical protein Golax_010720, partial [Gossypium laxum]|nr:hypothetical protein [Gossypium laxum]
DVVEDGFPDVSWRDKLVRNVEERGLEDEIVVESKLDIGEDDYTISTEDKYPKITFSKRIHEWIDRSMAKTVVVCLFGKKIGYKALVDTPKYGFLCNNSDFELAARLVLCGSGDEMVIHALRNCPKARGVIVASGFDNRLLTKENNAIFGGKEEDVPVIWERAHKLNDDFQIHNFSIVLILPRNRTGLGIILRDSNDFVLCGRVIFIDKAANSEWAELDALLEGIRLA